MTDPTDPLKAAREAAESGQRFHRGVMDSAQQVWLAGLGALARTQQEGGKFFDALVEEGARVSAKTHQYAQTQLKQAREQAEPWVDGARKQADAAFGKLEQVLDTRLGRALKRMQVPSRADIDDLARRIDALTREIHATRAPRQATKPAAAKRAPRKPKA